MSGSNCPEYWVRRKGTAVEERVPSLSDVESGDVMHLALPPLGNSMCVGMNSAGRMAFLQGGGTYRFDPLILQPNDQGHVVDTTYSRHREDRGTPKISTGRTFMGKGGKE
ncbi:MAG: hypothetical protein ABIH92_04815 [Nanoarchaeota archaeon]